MPAVVPLPVRRDAEATALLAAAFADYPAMVHIAPDRAQRARFLSFLFSRWVPLVRGVDGSSLLCVLGPASELQAVSLLLPPDRAAASPGVGFREPTIGAQLLAGLAELPFRFGPWSFVRVVKMLVKEEQARRAMARVYGTGGAVWYQDYLASHPDAQSRGLGSVLLEHQKRMIWSRSDCPIVLQTYAPRARGFYRRNGFEEVGWVTNGGPEWWYVLETKSGKPVDSSGLGFAQMEPPIDTSPTGGAWRWLEALFVVLFAMPVMAPIALLSALIHTCSRRSTGDTQCQLDQFQTTEQKLAHQKWQKQRFKES